MTFADKDMERLVECLCQTAAEEIRPRFRNLAAADIAEKTSAIDLVTQADLHAEKRITAFLKERFPGALVVGEEAFDADRSVVAALEHASLAFVIDPVDGTLNFAAGFPVFGTILAVVQNGETVAGLVYDPLLGDRLTAMRGAGACLIQANGAMQRVNTAPPAPLDQMIGTFGWAYMTEPDRSRICANMAKLRMAFGFNCSAYEYWLTATGRLHFTGHGKMTPWDHLAGVLITQEAGGYAARFDGSVYKPWQTSGGILAASDKETWELVRRALIGPVTPAAA